MSTLTSRVIAAGMFSIPILYHLLKPKLLSKSEKIDKKQKLANFYRTPFPPAIREMLSKSRLAYMSTVDGDSSHLSLMRFTYLNDETDGEVVILSTQRATKKYDMLTKQNGVALLIHDFPQFGEEKDGVHSITLNGQCSILEDGEKSEMYRAAHLKHNPDYPQFIVGEDIAMLCIFVSSARICNINDHVERWSAEPRK